MNTSRILLVSPIREFHIYSKDMKLTPKYLTLLVSTLRWTADLLRDRGFEVRTVLDVGGLDGGETPEELMRLFFSSVWAEAFSHELEETISTWCGRVALMPEARIVDSALVRSIRESARLRFIPVVDVEELLGISEGDFRKDLDAIERGILDTRQRSKIIMRGSRVK